MAQESVAQQGRIYPPPPAPESHLPPQLAVLVTIGLQLALPQRLTIWPTWVLPAIEAALLMGLFIATPNHLVQENPRRRRLALTMTALVTFANVASLAALIHYLLRHEVSNGHELIGSGLLIWLTNFLIFALWYWELDRGGPGRRASGRDGTPDFLFPQMSDDVIEPRDWRPQFVDYLYVSLTNATAFSPTDTMPLSVMAKTVMGVQAIISLITIGLVFARAVNIL